MYDLQVKGPESALVGTLVPLELCVTCRPTSDSNETVRLQYEIIADETFWAIGGHLKRSFELTVNRIRLLTLDGRRMSF